MCNDVAAVRRFGRLCAGWLLLLSTIVIQLQAGSYRLAYWREPGAAENHGNHSAYVHVWDENGQPLAGKRVYTSWGVLLGATDANGFVEIELRRPNGYDFQVRDGAHTSETTPVLSVERAPNWGLYSYEVGFLYKQNAANPGVFDTNHLGTINESAATLCDLTAPCTRSLAYYSTSPTDYCSDEFQLGSWTAFHGQTFVATGNRIVAVKAMMAAGFNVHYYWTAQILEGGPNGALVGPARSTRVMVDGEYFPILVKWGMNEAQVVPGRTYFLKISVTGGVNVWRVNRDSYAGGSYYQNDTPIPGADLMGMVLCASYTNSGPLGTLAGWVRDAAAAPLRGAVVTVPGANLYAISGADGSYSIPLVPAGTHDVSATKPGYVAGLNQGVVVDANMTAMSTFTLAVQTTSPGGGIVTNGNSYLQPFEILPAWTSSFDASWGNAAAFTLEAGGQSGSALQARRSGPGSSSRVQVFPVRPNTAYSISVWVRCPNFTSPYWAECGYKLGGFTAQDFDGNSATWSLLRKFSDTGENGNGNVWRQYAMSVTTGGSGLLSVGFKLGASAGAGPTVRWDQLAVVSLALPQAGSAVATSSSNLTVQFREPISEATATNIDNYTLTSVAGTVPVLSAGLLAGTNVVLWTGPQAARVDYTLAVSNVINPMQPATLRGGNDRLAIRIPFSLLIPSDVSRWKYETTGLDQGTAWRLRDFDDGAWPAGSALLGVSETALSEPIRTPLANVTNTITAYFRAPFVLPLGAANALLRLQPLVADGAVFWLNGSELFRIGLPKDPVTHLTPASRSVALPAYEGPFDFAAPSLVAGTNILAVEIHKTTAEGAQLVIGAMLDALILPSQLPAPVLHITPQEGAVTLAWSEPGMTLEMAANVAGPWVPQPGLVSPTTLPGTNAASFFRLRQ